MAEVSISINGEKTTVPEGDTILSACQKMGVDTPTICYAENLTPVNACRVCVVEVEGARTLVPACSRKAEEGMQIKTHTDRVRTSRRMVLELLASTVKMDRAEPELLRRYEQYDADLSRYESAQHNTSSKPPKIQDNLYVRDYSRCVLCYKCVQACGEEAQHTFAIAVAGRGAEAEISTEFDTPLPESACVYCGNCIGVCPTGALIFTPEFELREADQWDPEQQDVARTVCPYCGVGCNLEIRTQGEQVVRVTSPSDHEVSHGHLCIKGRFGTSFVKPQNRPQNKMQNTNAGGKLATDKPITGKSITDKPTAGKPGAPDGKHVD